MCITYYEPIVGDDHCLFIVNGQFMDSVLIAIAHASQRCPAGLLQWCCSSNLCIGTVLQLHANESLQLIQLIIVSNLCVLVI